MYTREARLEAMRYWKEAEPLVQRELALQRQHFSTIYQNALKFCEDARAGLITSELFSFIRKDGVTCGCYYGSTAQFNDSLAIVNNRKVKEKGGYKLSTSIEDVLYQCNYLEEENEEEQKETIPFENPLLGFLVLFIENYVQENPPLAPGKTGQ